MPTASGHTTAILASKVQGTPVYNVQGDKVGTVEDIVLDKTSNNIMFAVLGSGGVLGVGEKYRPIPWSVLDYDQKMGGYVVPLDRKGLDNAPAYRMEDLTRNDGGGAIMSETYSYYKVPAYWSRTFCNAGAVKAAPALASGDYMSDISSALRSANSTPSMSRSRSVFFTLRKISSSSSLT